MRGAAASLALVLGLPAYAVAAATAGCSGPPRIDQPAHERVDEWETKPRTTEWVEVERFATGGCRADVRDPAAKLGPGDVRILYRTELGGALPATTNRIRIARVAAPARALAIALEDGVEATFLIAGRRIRTSGARIERDSLGQLVKATLLDGSVVTRSSSGAIEVRFEDGAVASIGLSGHVEVRDAQGRVVATGLFSRAAIEELSQAEAARRAEAAGSTEALGATSGVEATGAGARTGGEALGATTEAVGAAASISSQELTAIDARLRCVPAHVVERGEVRFELHLTNTSPLELRDVRVQHRLPVRLRALETGGAGEGRIAGDSVAFDVASMDPGEAVVLRLLTAADGRAPAGGGR